MPSTITDFKKVKLENISGFQYKIKNISTVYKNDYIMTLEIKLDLFNASSRLYFYYLEKHDILSLVDEGFDNKTQSQAKANSRFIKKYKKYFDTDYFIKDFLIHSRNKKILSTHNDIDFSFYDKYSYYVISVEVIDTGIFNTILEVKIDLFGKIYTLYFKCKNTGNKIQFLELCRYESFGPPNFESIYKKYAPFPCFYIDLRNELLKIVQ